MKKFLRKTLSCLLIAAMLVTALPAGIFASSGGSSGPSTDAAYEDLTLPGYASYNSAQKHSFMVADKYYYVLAIHTGAYVGSNLKEIILNYDTYVGTSHSQVLRPDFTGYNKYRSKFNSTFIQYVPDGLLGLIQASGSVLSTYARSAGYYPSGNLDYQSVAPGGYTRHFNLYNSWGGRALSGTSGGVKEQDLFGKIQSGDAFRANGTTYLAFESEYDFQKLNNIQFFFENNTGRDFSCNGWELYQVEYPQETKIESFAFISDALELSFDGTMLYRTTESTNAVMKREGLQTDQYDAINYIFYPISEIDSVPRPSGVTAGQVTDDYNSVIKDYHFFESCRESVNSKDRAVYNFVIDIADTYGAGLEEIIKSPSGESRYINDCLHATIEYDDKFGNSKTVRVPVLSNAFLEYAVNNDETDVQNYDPFIQVSTGDYISIAQQGESLCFSVEFPSISNLKYVTVEYNNELTNDDDFIVSGISVYNNWGETQRALRESYTRFSTQSIDMAPVGARLLYQSDNSGSVRLTPTGSSSKFHMDPIATEEYCKVPERNYEGQNVYLVTLTTDDPVKSGTTADVFLQLTYDTLDGKTAKSLEYNIRESCVDYMGYNRIWIDDAKYGEGDFSYVQGMSRGNSISFLVSLKNVKEFKSGTFRIAETNDEWQLADLKITRLETLSKRKLNTQNAGSGSLLINGRNVESRLNGIYERTHTGTDLIDMHNVGVYLINGEERTLNFTSGTSQGEIKTRDYSEYENFMDYATAMGDLKFDSAEKNYEVKVKVASNSTSATTNDDCGSSNLFYFQLVFKSGKRSAYVLANQQLNADGFRSGKTESFVISCNTDMGDVASVNIIPDDSTAESDALDKLCIENIEIIKHNAGSVSKRYYAENIGWIAPVYRDTTSQTDVEGRSEAQLATNIPITSFGYMLKLEFDIGYGEYPIQTLPDGTEEPYPQFEGNMTASVSYYTTNNEFKTIPVQVVQNMYEYDGKTPVIDEKTGNYISNPEWMFRANTTDRFIVDVDDISQLVSIKLIGSPTQNTVLPIKDISVKITKGTGVLRMNTFEEYQMVYEDAPTLLTEVNDPVPNGKYSFTAYAKDGRTFLFADNTIPKFDEDTSLESVIVPRVPDSAQDTMNMYVYMHPDTPDPAVGDYTLTGSINYSSSATSTSYKTVTSDFKNIGKDNSGCTVLYADNLSVSNMSVINNINLSCEHIRRNDIMVDHAVLQQVRNGVVIDTYTVNFQSSIIGKAGGVSSGPYSLVNQKSEGTKQIVTIQLGADTMDYKLTPEKIDLAVALEYTTKAKTIKGGASVFTSPFVFASDDPATTDVHKGKILQFEFNEVGVDQIIGIKAIGVGGIPATIEAATVTCYEADSNNASVPTAYFSFEPRPTVDPSSGYRKSNPIKLSRNEIKISHTDDNIIYANTNESSDYLRRMDISFRTTESSSVIDSAGTAPIRMKVTYKLHNGNKTTSSMTIPDIRNFVTNKEKFVAGSEVAVSVYLPGLESVYSVELEPYDSDDASLCAWNLDTISYKVEGAEDSSVHTVPVKKTIYEGSPLLVNLSTIYVELNYQYNGISGTVVNAETKITADHGTIINFKPVVYQSTGGYTAKVYRIADDGEKLIQTYENSASSFDYRVENTGNAAAQYKMVVASKENNASQCIVYLTIPAQPVPEKTNAGEQ